MQVESERDTSKPQFVVADTNGVYQIQYIKENSETVFRFYVPPESLSGKNTTVVMFLNYMLHKTAEQSVLTSNGLINDCIILSAKEVREVFGFATTSSAKRAIEGALNLLLEVRVEYVKKNELKKKIEGKSAGVVYNYEYADGVFEILLNMNLPWEDMAKQMALYPRYAFSLEGKTSGLMDHVLYTARQNTRKISKDGFFHIQAETLRARLNLPEPEESKQPQRDIRGVLEDTVSAVEKYYEDHKVPVDEQFKFEWVNAGVPKEVPIRKYLKEARLKVIPSPNIFAEYSRMSEKTETKRSTSTGRRRGRPPKPKQND